MADARAELGRWGEDLAARHLVATGAVVLARNWRCRQGELDIVALEPTGTVVFCEVKTRSGTAFGEPAEAVGPVKARRIRAVACRWLAEHRPAGSHELRFDVVSVVRARGEPPRVVHLRAAF
ncbi:MAG TPA: YraN family protein [Mycobacteriales bacterium]|nr:YraN family protein [Mycobacteriales bacterium]